MISKKQYSYLKEQYENELRRFDTINKKAQIFLSINSFIITALFFNLKDLIYVASNLKNHYYLITLLFSFLVILISCIFIILTLKIRYNEVPTSMSELENEIINNIDDNSFTENRVVDYIVATERNIMVNNSRAINLRYSLLFLILGFISIFLFISLSII